MQALRARLSYAYCNIIVLAPPGPHRPPRGFALVVVVAQSEQYTRSKVNQYREGFRAVASGGCGVDLHGCT